MDHTVDDRSQLGAPASWDGRAAVSERASWEKTLFAFWTICCSVLISMYTSCLINFPKWCFVLIFYVLRHEKGFSGKGGEEGDAVFLLLLW